MDAVAPEYAALLPGYKITPHPSLPPQGGKEFSWWCVRYCGMLKTALKYLLGLAFAAAGANHFVMTDFYLSIMPPYLPWHTALVYVSGVFEVALGFALLWRRVEKVAAWGMIALIVAVTPANAHMAIHAELYPQYSSTALWVRMVLQIVLVAWAYWYTQTGRSAK